MLTRRAVLACAALLALALPARSADRVPFTAAAFERAQAEDAPILVHVTAPWCGTCRTQKRVLPDLLATQDLSRVVWLEVDFDTQPDVWQAFDARRQSAMVIFKGREEVARAVGETSPEALRNLLAKALQ